MHRDRNVVARAKALLAREPSGVEQLRMLRAEFGLTLEQAKEALVSAGVGLEEHDRAITNAIVAARDAGLFDATSPTPWSRDTMDPRIDDAAAQYLTLRGLPGSVGTLRFGERYARREADAFVIGEDTGHAIAIELPSQRVVIDDGSHRSVNASVAALGRCLDAYARYREDVCARDESDDASALVERFARAILAADSDAAAPERYWGVILEQIRHGLL